MAERVGQQLGNYQVLRVLGHGAFAEVYLGEHQYLEIPAAIKVLHVQMEPETQAFFRREARMLAHLQHHHIVRVLEFGIQEQTPYLVMEYAPNGTLRTLHPRGTRLPLEQIVSYVKQLAPALDYAHQQHVIHRDVKPKNMLLNAQHEVVLSDFGMAVVQQTMESLSLQNSAGTPLYMAPEQIQGRPATNTRLQRWSTNGSAANHLFAAPSSRSTVSTFTKLLLAYVREYPTSLLSWKMLS